MRFPPRRPAHSRRLWRFGAGAAVLAGIGCGGDGNGGTGPDTEVAGRYDIVQVNDDTTPPFTATAGSAEGSTFRLDVVSGSTTLASDGSYTAALTMRFTLNGASRGDEPVPTERGSYIVNGNTITFDPAGTDADAPNFTATRDGDTLTFRDVRAGSALGLTTAVTIVARRQ